MMGIFDWLGKGIGKDISEPIKAVGELYTTDKERIIAETKLLDVEQKPGLAQLENVKFQILSGKFFDRAWPSLIGWTAGAGIALFYIPQITFTEIMWMILCIEQHKVLPFPMSPADLLNLIYLLFGAGTFLLGKKKILG